MTHHYQPDTSVAADHRDERPCTCGMPRANRVHDVPERTADDRELEARMMGEEA